MEAGMRTWMKRVEKSFPIVLLSKEAKTCEYQEQNLVKCGGPGLTSQLLGRLREADGKFEVSLDHLATLSVKVLL